MTDRKAYRKHARFCDGTVENLAISRRDHRQDSASGHGRCGALAGYRVGREVGGRDEDRRARAPGRAEHGSRIRLPRGQQILAGPRPPQYRTPPGNTPPGRNPPGRNPPGNRLHGRLCLPARITGASPGAALAPPWRRPGAALGALPSLPRNSPLDYDGTLPGFTAIGHGVGGGRIRAGSGRPADQAGPRAPVLAGPRAPVLAGPTALVGQPASPVWSVP